MGKSTCGRCDRRFETEGVLVKHEESTGHHWRDEEEKPQKRACPFCSIRYKTVGCASRLAQHIEDGACRGVPGMDAEEMYKLVRSKDHNEQISRTSVVLENTTRMHFIVSEKMRIGSGYACYFCDGVYGTLKSLDAHLNQNPLGRE